jgi:hypothetical protein
MSPKKYSSAKAKPASSFSTECKTTHRQDHVWTVPRGRPGDWKEEVGFKAMGLIEHFEKFLGLIEAGWSVDADGLRMPFQIARFPQGSGPGTVSFATLGLGRYPLPSLASGRSIRHELLLLAPESLKDGTLPSLIHQIGEETIQSGRALLQGVSSGRAGHWSQARRWKPCT